MKNLRLFYPGGTHLFTVTTYRRQRIFSAPEAVDMKQLIFLLAILLLVTGCSMISDATSTSKPTDTISPAVAQVLSKTPPSTITPSPTATRMPFTVTQQILTPTLAPIEPTTKPELGSETIAYKIYSRPGIYLLDLDTGYSRQLQENKDDPLINLLGWSEDGCEMVVLTNSGEILRVDLQGNILDELLSVEYMPYRNRDVILSPSWDKIAYRISEGESLGGYNVIYEFENIEVIKFDDPSTRYRLTTGNGARDVAWSPDGEHLAFGDFDNNGIYQLYISRWDGNDKIQLTHFSEPEVENRVIRWSPSGEKIAFAHLRLGNITPTLGKKTDLMILDLSSPAYPITIAQELYYVNMIWWQDDQIVVSLGEPEPKDTSKSDMSINWINASNGEIIHRLRHPDTPPGYMDNPGPMTDNRFGFFARGLFFIYDFDSQAFKQKDNVLVYDVGDWLDAPTSFIGEQGCNTP